MGSTGLSIAYGITHDLVTAHVAVEHFTVHHERLVPSESPVVMALLWGVIATWWFGAGAGLLFALAAQIGDGLPKWLPQDVLRAERRVLVGLWISAMLVLVGTYAYRVSEWKGNKAEFEIRSGFMRLTAVMITHVYSYIACAVAAVGLLLWILVKRIKAQSLSPTIPQSPDS